MNSRPLVILGTVATLALGQAQAQQAPAPAAAVPPIEQRAVDILKAACNVLAGARTIAFDALSTYERAARNGQPLYYSVLNRVTMERPGKLRVITPGDGVPDEFYYNGKTITAYVPGEDLAAVADAPATIDAMVDVAWQKAAIYFPFTDVILSNPCAVFDQQMKSAFLVGQSKIIGGTVTDMVAVAGEDAQAELWIGSTDHLPRLIRVVYPHEPAHALYQTEYSNWRIGDPVSPGTFVSERAANAKPMPFAPPGAGQEPPRPGEPPPEQH